MNRVDQQRPEHGPPHRAWIVLTAILLWGCGADPVAPIDVPGASGACYTSTADATDIFPGAGGGSVWVGTPGGLLRFDRDGAPTGRWTRADGLAANAIERLLVGRDGSLWVATARGLSHRQGDGFESFTREDGLNSDQVLALAEDAAGRLFVGTRRGINLRDGDRFVPFDDTHEFGRRPTYDIHAGADGRVLFAKENALTEFDGRDGWRVFQRDPLIPGPFSDLPGNSLLQTVLDSDGRIWVGSTVGLGYLDDRGWQHVYYRDRFFDGRGPRDNRIEALAVDDGDGAIWIAHGDARDFDGGRGVSRVRDGQWSHWSAGDGLLDDRVRRVRGDGSGGAWLAGRGGAAHIGGDRITTFSQTGELPDNRVRRIVSFAGGRTVVLTARGLAWFEDGKKIVGAQPPWIPDDMCRVESTLFAVGDGRWAYHREGSWSVGSDPAERALALACSPSDVVLLLDTGMVRGGPGSWTPFREAVPLELDRPRLLGVGERLWAAGVDPTGALVEFREAGDSRFTALPDNERLLDVAVTADGDVWLASADGLRSPSGDRRLAPPGFPRFAPRVLQLDARGRLWVGTRDAGVLMWDGDRWHELRFAGRRLPAEITALVFEDDDTLWVGSADEGALRLSLTAESAGS